MGEVQEIERLLAAITSLESPGSWYEVRKVEHWDVWMVMAGGGTVAWVTPAAWKRGWFYFPDEPEFDLELHQLLLASGIAETRGDIFEESSTTQGAT